MPYPGRTPTNPPMAPTASSSTGPLAAASGMPMSPSAAQAFAVTVLDRHESELVQQAMEAVASRDLEKFDRAFHERLRTFFQGLARCEPDPRASLDKRTLTTSPPGLRQPDLTWHNITRSQP